MQQGPGKPLHRVKTASADIIDPGHELVEVAAAHDAAKTHYELAHGNELRRFRFQGLNFRDLTWCQQRRRLHTKGTGNNGRDQLPRRGVNR